MFKELIENLQTLCRVLRVPDCAAIDDKLSNINKRLDSIEHSMRRQGNFTVYAFLYGAFFSMIGIGAAFKEEQPGSSLVLILVGLLGMIIISVVALLTRRFRR